MNECGRHGKHLLPSQHLPALKLSIETLEQGVKYVLHWRRSGVFIVNLKHISHLVLVFLLLTLTM